MAAYAAGDVAAFEALYVRHQAGLYRFIRRLLGSWLASHADEVFQDTWLRVVQARERWQPQGATFRSWLFTLAHHRVIDLLRRAGREVSIDASEDGVAPWEPDGVAWQHWPRPGTSLPSEDLASPSRSPDESVESGAERSGERHETRTAARNVSPSTDRAASPLETLRASVAAEPERWRWSRDGAAALAIDESMPRWLAQLDAAIAEAVPRAFPQPGLPAESKAAATTPGVNAAAATPGVNAAAATAGVASADDPVTTLRFFRNGRLAATLRLGATDFTLVSPPSSAIPGMPSWRAPIAPERARSLRFDLP